MAKAAKKAAPPKKTTGKTAAGKTKTSKSSTIKYTDKSAGQPELVPIFNSIVKLLEPYAKGSLEKIGGKEGQVTLVSKKEVELAGKKVKEIWFAGALVQKGYVGFYYMPVYVAPEIKPEIGPELLKCLKGKSCFHIKKLDDTVFTQIQDALKKGYALYKKKQLIG